MTTQNGWHEELFAILVSHQQGGFVVAGLVAVVDDVGGIVSELLFLAKIAVVYDSVDMADGAVEADLVEVVKSTGVV